jgi:transcriptional regulator with XRE-family HTH domain
VSLPTRVEWERHFRDVPPAFYRLLAELLQEVRAEGERERGVERRGRRPALAVGSMDDVLDLVYPKRSEKPFAEALRDATGQSMSTVARMAGMNPGTLHALMAGTRPLTKARIEEVARAIHVNPGYFHEYRVLVVHEAIDALLDPHRSLQAYASVEPAHYANPAPKTPNAPAGYSMYGRPGSRTVANPAKPVEGHRA